MQFFLTQLNDMFLEYMSKESTEHLGVKFH